MAVVFKALKALGVGLVLISSVLHAHGDIESIKCFDSKNKLKMMGVQEGEPLNMKISIESKGKSLVKNELVVLSLEDSFDKKEKAVIENIKFNLPKKADAKRFSVHLKIKETTEEVRKGFGSLTLKSKFLSQNMLCIVKY